MDSPVKKCPICGEVKNHSEFDKYYDKNRKMFRVGNYCKPCRTINARERSKAYYYKKQEERKQYQREFRANPANKEKINKASQKFKKKYRQELHNVYVVDDLSQKLKCKAEDIKKHPELIELHRNTIKLKRKLKDNGTK